MVNESTQILNTKSTLAANQKNPQPSNKQVSTTYTIKPNDKTKLHSNLQDAEHSPIRFCQ